MSLIEEGNKYLMPNYSRFPVSFDRGEGMYLYDDKGKRYLDMLAGIAVNILGYNHPLITETICKQAKEIIHISNLFYIKPQIELAKRLVESSVCDKAFFCNSGAEANEAAIKLVRKYFRDRGENRYEIITFKGGFHGRTLAALSATATPEYQRGFEPLVEGFRYAEFNSIESVLENINEKTAAIMLEIIQGEGGVNPAEKDFLKEIQSICNERGILLVIDEVQTGIGRTGKLFAYQHFGLSPDIITLAKGLGGGIPIGAVLAKKEIADSFSPGTHGSTFGGNYLSTAVAKEIVDFVNRDEFLNDVYRKGEYLKEKLKSEFGYRVKGLGLMVGMELPGGMSVKEVVKKSLEYGLIVGMAGKNTLRFVPPLIVNEEHIDEAVDILKKVIK